MQLYHEIQNKYVSTLNIDQKIVYLKTMILMYKRYFYLLDKNTFIEFSLKEFIKYQEYLKSLLRNGKIEFEFSLNSLNTQSSGSNHSITTSIFAGGCQKNHACQFTRINKVLLKVPCKNQLFSFCCVCARHPTDTILENEGKPKKQKA